MKIFVGSFYSHSLIIVILAVFVTACEGEKDIRKTDRERVIHKNSRNDQFKDSSKKILQLPEEKMMPISKEGMVDSVNAKLYHSPDYAPVQFLFYYPAELQLKEYKKNGFTVELLRNAAVLQLHFYPDEVETKAEALELAKKKISEFGDIIGTESGFRLVSNGKLTASIEVLNKNGKYAYWLKNYPVEYGDGFGAEVYFIKQNIKWDP